MAYEIVDSNYGKNWVKLLHVQREGPLHSIREWEVSTELTLDNHKDYLRGDNSDIIATDSQKNTVYLLAKKTGLSTPEVFGQQLCAHFLDKYRQVVRVRVSVDVHPWRRVQAEGVEHEHAFVTSREEVRFCEVVQRRQQPPDVSSGLRDLQLLKTTQSAFVDFVRDEFRSLPDMHDRVFSTVVYAKWSYSSRHGRADYDQCWRTAKSAILDLFAGPARGGLFSPSVQKTLHDAQTRILDLLPAVEQVEMVMPNKHYFSIDLSKFPRGVGSASNQDVFLPVDKPSGNIRAVLRRSKSKL